MKPLLDDASVAHGILSITRRSGAHAVTARSLAAELHVSLGALYNYTSSMLDAMQNADRHVYDAMTAVLSEATADPAAVPVDAVCAWARSELPLIDLIADLTRPHAPLPLSLLDLLPETSIPLPRATHVVEIIRSFVGLWRAGAPDLDGSDVHTMVEMLSVSLDAYDPEADHRETIVPKESLHALAVDHIATSAHDRIDDTVRAASVEIMLEGGWSFRSLQSMTGLPLARLNRMSPREDHVLACVTDLVGGIVVQQKTDGRSPVETVRSIATTVAANPALFIDVPKSFLSLSLIHAIIAGAGILPAEEFDHRRVLLALGLATAVLHAGHMNRASDPTAATSSIALALDIAERSGVYPTD